MSAAALDAIARLAFFRTMTSLYITSWKAFVRLLIKLLLKLWSLILYLRSFSSRFTQHFFTPKPRLNGLLDDDLEGGRTALVHSKLKRSPFTSTLSSPCVRRPRAITLATYHPPCAKYTPRRTVIASRPSALSLSAVENGVATDNRLSEDSFYPAPSTCLEEPGSYADIRYRVLELDSDKLSIQSKRMKLVRQQDLARVDVNKVKGTKTRRQMSLPSKCLSPLKTLSLASYHLEQSPQSTPTPSASLIALNDSAPNHQIGHHGYSFSVDQGLSMTRQLLGMSQYNNEKIRSLAYKNLERHPWPISSHISDHCPSNMHSKENLCTKPEGVISDPISANFDTERYEDGSGPPGVSYVNEMCSALRTNIEQDGGLNARNIFNRESILTYRKSYMHSQGAKTQSFSVYVQNDQNIPSVGSQRTHGKYISHTPRATVFWKENVPPVACAGAPIRLDCHGNQALERKNFRFRHRSVTHGLEVSPSMQLQIKVEKIKRQRKVRQEMIARKKLLYSRRSNRDTYEWFAEDVQAQDCDE